MENDTPALDALFADASLGAPENAVGFVLWRLVHRYQREADRALVPLDLTHLQFMTLTMAAWLARSGEPVPQATLSRFGDIHPMQLSHMLKALAGKELIARTPNPADVRAKHVEVTAAGRAALRRALPVVIEVQHRLFGDEGAPGGALLDALVRLDREHLEN
jgi:DNA-binding MarR family transcriptional regulator